mmetsp:Transcript_13898/g.48034  ORF Transcript_13898/g.48034 Transcript_13898/m.48034 type:complete len:208 (-) Transcript_13898:1554-2177(-)
MHGDACEEVGGEAEDEDGAHRKGREHPEALNIEAGQQENARVPHHQEPGLTVSDQLHVGDEVHSDDEDSAEGDAGEGGEERLPSAIDLGLTAEPEQSVASDDLNQEGEEGDVADDPRLVAADQRPVEGDDGESEEEGDERPCELLPTDRLIPKRDVDVLQLLVNEPHRQRLERLLRLLEESVNWELLHCLIHVLVPLDLPRHEGRLP